MDIVRLVLTNPYAYDRALNLAIAEARTRSVPLSVVFIIDPEALDSLMVDLGEKGWLGMASRRTLRDSMLAGYRALAEDSLEMAGDRARSEGLVADTQLEETPLKAYLEGCANSGIKSIFVSASRALPMPRDRMVKKVSWIEEG